MTVHTYLGIGLLWAILYSIIVFAIPTAETPMIRMQAPWWVFPMGLIAAGFIWPISIPVFWLALFFGYRRGS
jgi:hypothetical protein